MQPDVVDPTDRRVLERNYDYAQKNLWILSMWYEYDVERMVELLAVNGVPLSANDERRFGAYYDAIQSTHSGSL
ncbi:hypothetical protein HALLA_12500 [Halostagnicola larsenii XH-48]|uniref:Uncharacterized protein n=1 Tax=Halostagnicola larsenii XH-48 TaxID=797299 RepID=W0JLL6_9EURY|nr:hypothetical protein [Halostagnicola larsenii]AHF99483.1 hypothetical protein HALLA_12500 [Halostagnicola larsenii XH-48]